MDTRPIRPHPLIPPLLIAIVSLFGLCVILALAFFPEQNVELVPTRTPTPFKYQFLATETLIPTPVLETETAQFRVAPTEARDTATLDAKTTPLLIVTQQNATSSRGVPTLTATLTPNPIFGNAGPLTAGKYDDTGAGFTYIGVWNAEENSYAYQETVHVSDEVDDYVAFSFTGTQLLFGYQNNDDAGEITVEIDGLEETMSQRVGSLWFSYDLEPGTHYAVITHTSEGPINLDYVEIEE